MARLMRRTLGLVCVVMIVAAILPGRAALAAHISPAVIATIPAGFSFPEGLAVDPVANRIYVTGGACCSQGPGGAVSVIDGATNTVIATIPITAGAIYAAVNPATDRLYVTHGNGGPNIVTVIDTLTNAVVTTIAVGARPDGVAVNPITDRVYVANNGGSSVSVIDGATNTVVGAIPLAFPVSVTLDPVVNRVYVTTNGTNVAVIDGATNAVLATIPDRSDTLAFGIGTNPVTNRLYVPRFSGAAGGSVAVMDIAANAVVASIPVGSQPNGVGVNPATNRVYVAVRLSNRVAVIDGATNTVVSTIAVGSIPFDVASNTVTDRVYVANTLGHTISVIADVFADLSLSMTDSPDPVRAGQELTYTIVVTNNGVSTATGVTLIQSLPDVAGFPSAAPSQGTCAVTRTTVTCDLGSLAVGASSTVIVAVRVTRPGTITSTASVTANEPDPILANNSAEETTTVTARVP
jgi:uncharacterized repeat protein (TIGR01451 family)